MKLFKNCVYENGKAIYFHRQEKKVLVSRLNVIIIIFEYQMAAKYFRISNQIKFSTCEKVDETL